jgi:hypothetical protein
MDIEILKKTLWSQFGAAIDMLENAVVACPDAVWSDESNEPPVWYLAYHTLFWLDYYLSAPSHDFHPPQPFTLAEMDPAGVMPERVYTKDELFEYLAHGRAKCRAVIDALTAEKAQARAGYARPDLLGAELLLYNMRHVQHGAAQINQTLRRIVDDAPRWVAKAKGE